MPRPVSLPVAAQALPVGFFVPGEPATKGSWRSVKTRRGRRAFIPDNPRSVRWEANVRTLAALAYRGPILDGVPVAVRVRFRVTRPASHFRGPLTLRPGAPLAPAREGSGDLDKLVRAVLDALSGVIYKTDAAVVLLSDCSKLYADTMNPPGVTVEVAAF